MVQARVSFEPLLDALRRRTVHIMKRLYGITEFMLDREGHGLSETHHQPFQEIVRRIFDNFVFKTVDDCLLRCKDDLKALTRFVTWDLHERSAGALQRSLPNSHMIQVLTMQQTEARKADKGFKGSGMTRCVRDSLMDGQSGWS
jgi:hypothetical protein